MYKHLESAKEKMTQNSRVIEEELCKFGDFSEVSHEIAIDQSKTLVGRYCEEIIDALIEPELKGVINFQSKAFEKQAL